MAYYAAGFLLFGVFKKKKTKPKTNKQKKPKCFM